MRKLLYFCGKCAGASKILSFIVCIRFNFHFLLWTCHVPRANAAAGIICNNVKQRNNSFHELIF